MYRVILSSVRRVRSYVSSSYFRKIEDTVYFKKNDFGSFLFLMPEKEQSASKETLLDITSAEDKAVIQVSNSFFTFLFQEFPAILIFYSRIKNRSVKLYIHYARNNPLVNEELFKFFLGYLDRLGVSYEIIDSNRIDEVKANNVYAFATGFEPVIINLVHNKTRRFVKDKSVIPFRKVFVGRKQELSQRINDSAKIQEFFFNNGFDIVYPEDFNSLEDQIDFFNECKVLAGISGSGLSNSVFMKPGGTVIEVSSLFDVGGEEFPSEIHDFYRVIAMYRGHLYFSVSNVSKDVEQFMQNHPAIKFIKML